MISKRSRRPMFIALLALVACFIVGILTQGQASAQQPIICGSLVGQFSQLPLDNPETDTIRWTFKPTNSIAFQTGSYTHIWANIQPPPGTVGRTGEYTQFFPVIMPQPPYRYGVWTTTPVRLLVTDAGYVDHAFAFDLNVIYRDEDSGRLWIVKCEGYRAFLRIVMEYTGDGSGDSFSESNEEFNATADLSKATLLYDPAWTPTPLPTATRRVPGPGRSTPVPGVTPTPAQQNSATATPTRTPIP